jgi:putative ABC transport system permease protein
MDSLIQDIRTAVRSLKRSPGFTAVAMLTLATAVGANAAILSIADAVLFRPLPYSEPDRAFLLHMLNPSTGRRSTLVPFEYLRAINERHRGLSEAGLSDDGPRLVVTTGNETVVVPSIAVSANYFDILQVKPARGRLFDLRVDLENGRPAILSYASWMQRFGGDPGIIGRSVQLGTSSFDVVGVLPKNFFFPTFVADRPELITLMPPVQAGEKGGTFYPVVRLEPGVSRNAAQAEIDALVRPLTAQTAAAVSMPVLDDVRETFFPAGKGVMSLLLAGALALLLLGCANLANMLVVRGRARARELAVRLALGARVARVIRPVVIEALMIGIAAGALAVLVTSSSFDALARQVPRFIYKSAPVGVDMRVFGFAFGLSVLGAFVFSVVPAWRSARLDVRSQLHGSPASGSPRHTRLGRPMIAAQVALAIVLVFGAAIASQAFISVLRIPLGFDPTNVIRINVSPPRGNPDSQAFYLRAIDSILRRGDVVSAGAAASMLLGSAPDDAAMTHDSREMKAGVIHVLPGYFETAGIGLVRGRFLDSSDLRTGGDTSAVIGESAARALFPNREPLGATFHNGRGRTFMVVGIVGDVTWSVTEQLPPQAYVIPGSQTRNLGVVVRMRERREESLDEVRRELAALAPGVPLTAAWWSDSIAAQSGYRNPRFQTIVLVTFATLALGLTGLGVFAVISFLVTMRTREMSIRIAMGAAPASLVAFVLRQALVPVTVGVVLGLIATQWAKRLAEAQLFKIDTDEPAMLAASVATVLLAATAAAYLPARRASRIDPIQALRAE